MKLSSIILLALSWIVPFQIDAQIPLDELSNELVVVADNLNFRAAPSLRSEVIAQLDFGDKLERIEVVKAEFGQNEIFFGYGKRWIKVRDLSTDEVGYVYGDYVDNQNVIYENKQDCSRIRKGNWYGLYQKGESLYLNEVVPKIDSSGEGFKYITSDSSKYKFYICNNEPLITGKLDGRIIDRKNALLEMSRIIDLGKIGANSFQIARSGTTELIDGHLSVMDDHISFSRIESDRYKRSYYPQEISDALIKFGEVGYEILFYADLNRDGVPDLFISEGDTRLGAFYYFLSNAQGKLELQGITWFSSKC